MSFIPIFWNSSSRPAVDSSFGVRSGTMPLAWSISAVVFPMAATLAGARARASRPISFSLWKKNLTPLVLVKTSQSKEFSFLSVGSARE